MTRPLRVVLVGPVLQDNLALQYLGGAIDRAGHLAEIVGYSERPQLDEAVRQMVERGPDLVGLGIAFQSNIRDYLLLMRELRGAGYHGHLTCGGHVPTFCYAELLRDAPELDTVVRHEGEQTIVALLDELGHGRALRDIPGLVWREGDRIVVGPVREPVLRLDELPRPLRPRAPSRVGGIPLDFVLTARGCVGECSYCCISAFSADGGVPFRLRDPDDVAEEVSELYHRRLSRAFFLQDDLFVLPSERKTLARVTELSEALRRRDVTDAVFWVKARPETITDAVCAALCDLGVIHLFLGVENASRTRLGYLGRTHQPDDNVRAIERALAHGITPSFNLMMFDPDCTLPDVALNLDLAERYVALPWNVCRTEVYSGTRLLERLQRAERLRGDYRSYGYLMGDRRAEVLFRVLRVSLQERAFACASVLNLLISLSFARQLHEHYFPGPGSTAHGAEVDELVAAVRRDTVRRMRAALDFAATADVRDHDLVSRFAVTQALAINAVDLDYRARARRLWERYDARGVALMARRTAPGEVAACGGAELPPP